MHSGNIFLYDPPVIFDCIEFNDSYRQIDILYEIAFLCMDLESFDQKDLAQQFLEEYHAKLNCFIIKEDEVIFRYFKCLRANIRAKVLGLSALQSKNKNNFESKLREVEKYLLKMKEYYSV